MVTSICCTTQYNTYLPLVTPTANCSDSIWILIFLYRILTALVVLYLVLCICRVWAPITMLLRLYSIVQFKVLQYCSSSAVVLNVAGHIYLIMGLHFTTWIALL